MTRPTLEDLVAELGGRGEADCTGESNTPCCDDRSRLALADWCDRCVMWATFAASRPEPYYASQGGTR